MESSPGKHGARRKAIVGIAVGTWQLVLGSWQLALGTWHLAVGTRHFSQAPRDAIPPGWENSRFPLHDVSTLKRPNAKCQMLTHDLPFSVPPCLGGGFFFK